MLWDSSLQSVYLLFDFAQSPLNNPWIVAGFGVNNGATDPFLLAFVGPIVGNFELTQSNDEYLQFKLDAVESVPTPEPATLGLAACAILGLAARRVKLV